MRTATPRPFIIAALLCLGLLVGCAITPSWRPAAGEPSVPIHVYRTAIHTVIGLPPAAPGQPLQEWSYGQKMWVYDARTTCSSPVLTRLNAIRFCTAGILRAWVWPSRGLVQVVEATEPLPRREPETVIGEPWTFHLTPTQVAAMRDWLQRSLDLDAPPIDRDFESIYYASRQRYWVGHTCHHYAAQALQAGGVPVGSLRGTTPWTMWRRLAALARADAAAASPAPSPATSPADNTPAVH